MGLALAAAPPLEHDPAPLGAVECGVYVEALPVVRVPVVAGRCQWDMATVAPGSSKVRLSYFNATGGETPKSSDSATVKRTNYTTFVRYYKTVSFKCPTGKPCVKE